MFRASFPTQRFKLQVAATARFCSESTDNLSTSPQVHFLRNVVKTFHIPRKLCSQNSNNIKYKSEDIIREFHIYQSTTHLANSCPWKGKIKEIDIEKEPDVEKDGEVIEENSDDKSLIFYESSKDMEIIDATFDFMESYSNFPQLRNGQLYLSTIHDA